MRQVSHSAHPQQQKLRIAPQQTLRRPRGYPRSLDTIKCRSNTIQTPAVVNGTPSIKVIGVGGCASQCVLSMWESSGAHHSAHLDLCVMNTDVQELAYNMMPDNNKLLLGIKAANWTSTRGDDSIGKAAALECADAIGDVVQGADMVLVVAGMGGGTGRGAASVVADIAKQHGAFTVGIAATPTSLTARQACSQAVHDLYQAADGLIMVPTHKLVAGFSQPRTSSEVYDVSNKLLIAGIEGMAGCVLDPQIYGGVTNLRHSMSGGSSWFGHGTAMGPERAVCAAVAAVNSPLRLADISEASSVVALITCPQDTSLAEVQQAMEVIEKQCSLGAEAKLYATTTPAPSGAVTVTIVATHPGPSSKPAQQSAVPVGFRLQ